MRERVDQMSCNCCHTIAIGAAERVESTIVTTTTSTTTWRRSSTMAVRLLQLVAVLLLVIGLVDSHPHVSSNTRLPAEFANHYPHHQKNDPAFRVFYGTGVSLINGFFHISLVCKTPFFIQSYNNNRPPPTQSRSVVEKKKVNTLNHAILLDYSRPSSTGFSNNYKTPRISIYNVNILLTGKRVVYNCHTCLVSWFNDAEVFFHKHRRLFQRHQCNVTKELGFRLVIFL